jgi:hypothetical protein
MSKRVLQSWTRREQTVLEYALQQPGVLRRDVAVVLGRSESVVRRWALRAVIAAGGNWSGAQKRTPQQRQAAVAKARNIVTKVDGGELALVPLPGPVSATSTAGDKAASMTTDAPADRHQANDAARARRAANARAHAAYMQRFRRDALRPAPWESANV